MTERLFVIRRPVAHRRAERLTAAMFAQEHAPGGVLAGLSFPARDDDWLCDVCSQRLDPHAEIVSVGVTGPSYALCHECTRSLLAHESSTHVALDVVPCDCPGCEPRTEPDTQPGWRDHPGPGA